MGNRPLANKPYLIFFVHFCMMSQTGYKYHINSPFVNNQHASTLFTQLTHLSAYWTPNYCKFVNHIIRMINYPLDGWVPSSCMGAIDAIRQSALVSWWSNDLNQVIHWRHLLSSEQMIIWSMSELSHFLWNACFWLCDVQARLAFYAEWVTIMCDIEANRLYSKPKPCYLRLNTSLYWTEHTESLATGGENIHHMEFCLPWLVCIYKDNSQPPSYCN